MVKEMGTQRKVEVTSCSSRSPPPQASLPFSSPCPLGPQLPLWLDLCLAHAVCVSSTPDTLLGFTARCRFSIHLSRSAAERQAKHFVPEDVVT